MQPRPKRQTKLVSIPVRHILSKLPDDISPRGEIDGRTKHFVAIRRQQPFERVSYEHELVVVPEWRTIQLRRVVDAGPMQVEIDHSMNVVAVGGRQALGTGNAGQLEQYPQPAGTGRLPDDAEHDP